MGRLRTFVIKMQIPTKCEGRKEMSSLIVIPSFFNDAIFCLMKDRIKKVFCGSLVLAKSPSIRE